jgi:hypothetical protein
VVVAAQANGAAVCAATGWWQGAAHVRMRLSEFTGARRLPCSTEHEGSSNSPENKVPRSASQQNRRKLF